MGKDATAAVATETKKRKKKKGRPSLLDLQKRALEQQKQQQQQQQRQQQEHQNRNLSLHHRSTRRNHNPGGETSPTPEFTEDDDDDDDDDERKEKKVKLVVRLPRSNQHFPDLPRPSPADSACCGSEIDANCENLDDSIEKRKIDRGSDEGEKVKKARAPLHGSVQGIGPTTPLPDKKLLVFILDRLQKKDTYGVFSEPVDPNELPDYHEVIEHPMDFRTIRNKLDEGLYSNLEELEADVFLICSNAMRYNSSDTVYFRQAKSIQELAKRDFENLRQEGEDGELQPKVVRRGRPPKHLKKPIARPLPDLVGPESTSNGNLATDEDSKNESKPYNLRPGPKLYKFRSPDGFLSSHRSQHGENTSELLSNWNNEFPASILRADMKYGNKQFSIDETRRDTYRQFHPSAVTQEPSLFNLQKKQLMAVGLHLEHSYARSLARFAANLGPVVWKIASKKIERVLPAGMKFVPGRVGENEFSSPPPFPSENHVNSSLSSSVPNSVILNRSLLPSKVNSPKELVLPRSDSTAPVMPSAFVKSEENQWVESSSTFHSSNITLPPSSNGHSQSSLSAPPDLNIGSVLAIGSPKRPDLALQL